MVEYIDSGNTFEVGEMYDLPDFECLSNRRTIWDENDEGERVAFHIGDIGGIEYWFEQHADLSWICSFTLPLVKGA